VITYYDTSAFVPLLVDEAGTALSEHLWGASDSLVTSRLLYVEASSAVAQARRQERFSRRVQMAALRRLDGLWPAFTVIDADAKVVSRAAVLVDRESLRAYDAVHCASAESVKEDTLVVATGDKALLAVCSRLGMTTANTARS
jgi:predicted nucleic acid-binding protein